MTKASTGSDQLEFLLRVPLSKSKIRLESLLREAVQAEVSEATEVDTEMPGSRLLEHPCLFGRNTSCTIITEPKEAV